MNRRLQERLDRLRLRVAQTIAPTLLPEPIKDTLHICGLIRAREVPFETEAEWRKWWLGEFDERGRMLRSPRMSEKEKERYTVAEKENILVSGGITQVLNYVGSASGNSTGFAQYFAVGNVGINLIQSNDTSVAGEYFRAIPSTSNITGTQIDVSAFFGQHSGNGIITNAGLFGVNASATIGSGTLMTHSLFQYTKVDGTPITADYLLSYV